MDSIHIETVVNHQCILGEGPVWDQKRNRILWLDISEGHIHQFTAATNSFKTFSVGEMVGAIALSGQRLIAVTENGFSFIDLENEAIENIIDPEQHIAGNRFNDGKCDPMGRFWAGTLPLTEDHPGGSVYTLHSDLTVDKKIENVSISNGMAWSLDQRTFYFIDSPTLQVVAYNYDNNTGAISDRRVVINMDVSEGFPDGMTIDTEGMLWIAHWGGWKVARWDPNTGKRILQIDLPVSQVTSCTFGGENFDDLYITSASIRLTNEQLQKEPLAGSLFVIRDCGFRGMPAFEFE
ncbi:SMP-30/gluconolactonase/LRE family protein [Segetibacter sp.]|jgi:sugar lactone lactonase YvrE|uniref:SMP-30/gluconolactonase/LRE family protein n=1 Tax=Segetibacter sp. TaxID=2231182 RepID=UPI00260C7504|nr:SMP-30/gluconolactonase/LRE family protein [Segetibacter sp.]MCW3078827.1 L-arabinolactonase [Segetibacter sp.]